MKGSLSTRCVSNLAFGRVLLIWDYYVRLRDAGSTFQCDCLLCLAACPANVMPGGGVGDSQCDYVIG